MHVNAKQEEPSESNTIRQALLHGYVVVSLAVRGRTLKDKDGKNYGKAPACIVDDKAADPQGYGDDCCDCRYALNGSCSLNPEKGDK